jgi:hypothetical protein
MTLLDRMTISVTQQLSATKTAIVDRVADLMERSSPPVPANVQPLRANSH